MFGDIGSGASLAGVVISLLGLGFAILQIIKVRGEARAAREAAEAARAEIRRELTAVDLARLDARFNALKQVHREGDLRRALDHYIFVKESLRDILHRYPGLSERQKEKIRETISKLLDIESTAESLIGRISPEWAVEFNNLITTAQSELLLELGLGLGADQPDGAG